MTKAKITKGKRIGMTGDEAVANAAAVINPDVVAAYPITPQTIIVEHFSDFVHDGEVDTEFVCVESEHSAMSACVGASATGARVFTASASQGVALMYEILFIASASRLPIVMAVANRALSGPINIHGELTDQTVCRDTGWISLFSESAQEAYDNTFLSFKIGENKDVSLPVMFGLDGFILTHALEGVFPLDRKFSQDFLPERDMKHPTIPGNPVSSGLLADGICPGISFAGCRADDWPLRQCKPNQVATCRLAAAKGSGGAAWGGRYDCRIDDPQLLCHCCWLAVWLSGGAGP